jgi:JAB1/Mov34/MPN/PAD-1 ubiquitin protease
MGGADMPQLVLINISDHWSRMKVNGLDGANQGRVMGCLLGQQTGRTVDISNSFEIKYSMVDGGVEIDELFLAKKTDQCECVTSCFSQELIYLLQAWAVALATDTVRCAFLQINRSLQSLTSLDGMQRDQSCRSWT